MTRARRGKQGILALNSFNSSFPEPAFSHPVVTSVSRLDLARGAADVRIKEELNEL